MCLSWGWESVPGLNRMKDVNLEWALLHGLQPSLSRLPEPFFYLLDTPGRRGGIIAHQLEQRVLA